MTRRSRGFTLLEIMVALAITGVVLSVVYGSVRSVGRTLGSVSALNELNRSAFALLEEMGRELSSAYLSPHGQPNGQAITHFYVRNEERYDMPQAELYFTTLGHAYSPLSMGESDQSEVCYTTRYSQSRDELVLLKKEDLTLDEVTCKDESLNMENRTYGEVPIPVATGIHPEKGPGYRLVGVQVECFTGTIADDDEEPEEEWDSSETRNLPNRVRVTLTYQDANDNLIPFSKIVLMRMAGASR